MAPIVPVAAAAASSEPAGSDAPEADAAAEVPPSLAMSVSSSSSSSSSSSLVLAPPPPPCESSTSSAMMLISSRGDGADGSPHARLYSSPLLLLQNESYFDEIPESSGCVLFLDQTSTATDDSGTTEWTMQKIQHLLQEQALALVEQGILASPIDSTPEIQQSLTTCRSVATTDITTAVDASAAAGRGDFQWWKHETGGEMQQQQYQQQQSQQLSTCLRNLTKMRRLLLNMTLILSSTATNSGQEKDAVVVVHVQPLDFSLAQVLLHCPASQEIMLQLLLQTFIAIHAYTSDNWEDSTEVLVEYNKLQQLLRQHLSRFPNTVVLAANRSSAISTTTSPPPIHVHLPFLAGPSVATTTANDDPDQYLHLLDIHKKRDELLQEFEQQSKNKKKHVTTTTAAAIGADDSAATTTTTTLAAYTAEDEQPQLKHHFVVVTPDEMSEEDFLEESFFMKHVNATLHRGFDPLTSRPRLAQVALTTNHVDALRSIFFKADGSLQESVAADAVQTSKHHYIEFQNATAAGKTDKRWQIPIRRHHLSSSNDNNIKKARGRPKKKLQKLMPKQQLHVTIATRQAVEQVLSQAGVLHSEHEHLHDMSLLLGGLEDQSLHHDLPRQYCMYSMKNNNKKKKRTSKKKKDESEAILGWEVNRLGYNHDMADRHAPSGIVIGMGDSNAILIGVQKDQLERDETMSSDRSSNSCGGSGEYCRIRNGRPDERFEIVRENEHLAVLKIPTGCHFTGDFQHAGVCNFPIGTPDYALMMDLFQKIDSILQQAPQGDDSEKTHAETTAKLLKMFCQFPGLNRICRFHTSTELNDTTIVVPRNAVGYYRCHDNIPDGRGGVSSSANTINANAHSRSTVQETDVSDNKVSSYSSDKSKD